MSGIMYHVPGATGDPAGGAAAKVFSLDYLKALYDKGGAWKYVRNQTADVSSFGESVTMASFPRLTAVTVDASTGAVAADNTTIAAATITINKIRAVNYQVPEIVFKQSRIDLRSAFAAEAARPVSDSIDAEMSAICATLTTNTAGALGSDITDDYVALALEKLVENHVSLDNPNDLVWILPASQYHAIRGLRDYGTAFKVVSGMGDGQGSADLQPKIDTIYGIPVIFRNDASMTVSGGKVGGLFYRDSVGIAIQRMPELRPIQYVDGTINVEMLTWCLFGINLLKEELAVQILTK